MQQNVSGAGASSIGLADGNTRVASHSGGSLATGNQVHQGNQAGVGSHDVGNSQVQESERSTAGDGNVHAGSDQPLQQSSLAINDGQNAFRRNGALGLFASAASAFDAAKDIMEALRSKHTSLAVNWR